ncbi:hypothetical protein KCP78_14475 [Salmonella enterica subsp. enterica]|nr:hypothetical protein KCP78_14475 [Salmonella enterica subsp. enterica]
MSAPHWRLWAAVARLAMTGGNAFHPPSTIISYQPFPSRGVAVRLLFTSTPEAVANLRGAFGQRYAAIAFDRHP